jgi:hypothetical protein
MRTILSLICILGISCVSLAQGKAASWGNLSKLRAGDKIQVVQTNSTKVSGDFLNVSDAAISLQGKAGTQMVQKQDVASVKLMKNKHRLRNALILGGIGAGVGAGIGAAAHNDHGCMSSQTFCLDIGGRSLPAAIFGVVGLLGGTVVGALLPEHETVYSLNSH